MKVGFIGWRGMVGSVLISRMLEENDFRKIEPIFFSTSDIGGEPPVKLVNNITIAKLRDAYDLSALVGLDCIVTCQGSAYTLEVLPKLQALGFAGYWLDASSSLRMEDDTIIILDPVNRQVIDNGLRHGVKQYSVGNCSVSCMLMAIAGLIKHDLVDWISTMTYQAASGAGANGMRELLLQSGAMHCCIDDILSLPNSSILAIEHKVRDVLLSSTEVPKQYFGAALAGSLIPWIDSAWDNGQTREEWKGLVETNKILGLGKDTIKVDGICVRVGSLRCHSQGLTIKLKNPNLSIEEINLILVDANPWVKLIPNTKEDTIQYLTPVAVSGTLDIAVGRVRKLNLGSEYLTLFTVGDQLLWGAAEPLRRMLNILVEFKS